MLFKWCSSHTFNGVLLSNRTKMFQRDWMCISSWTYNYTIWCFLTTLIMKIKFSFSYIFTLNFLPFYHWNIYWIFLKGCSWWTFIGSLLFNIPKTFQRSWTCILHHGPNWMLILCTNHNALNIIFVSNI